MRALVNGASSSYLSILDRGLLYGDGLFETLAVKDCKPLEWDWHLDRLETGCTRLHIPCPPRTTLRAEAEKLCRDTERAVLKIIVTRGIGERGYLAPVDPVVTRILYLSAWPAYPRDIYREGATVRLCEQRLYTDAALAGIKHLNRLAQVIARNEWRDPNIAEGLMCDHADRLIEATGSNIFLVEDNVLRTPDLTDAGVPGVMRRRILQVAAAMGIETRIGSESLQTLKSADEVFLSNSIAGIWPVRQFENTRYLVGPVTRRLQSAIRPFSAIDL